jgi:hypothetical protein
MQPEDILAWPSQKLVVREHAAGTYYETKSIDCGCPEALFEHGGLAYIAHFEEDGMCEVFVCDADGGETTVNDIEACNLDDLVTKALALNLFKSST